MPDYTHDGKMRSKLREAILAGFSSANLDQTLRDNDMLRPNIAIGPDLATRVDSLIDVARQEGWLIELCNVLAGERTGNEAVNSRIVAVQKWLIDQRDKNEIDFQFQQDNAPPLKLREHSYGFLRLLSAIIGTVALVGIATWIVSDKKETPQPGISTSGSPDSVVQGTNPGALPSSKIEAHSGGVAIGGNVQGSTINVAPAPSGETRPR